MRGLDLSHCVSGKALFSAQISGGLSVLIENCRLGAASAGTTFARPTSANSHDLIVSRVERTGLNYTREKINYGGTESVETTIVNSGSGSDGTTPWAKKIVTTANSKVTLPFECLPIIVWNETIGSAVTLTVECFRDNASAPTNADICMDVEYLGNASYPITSIVSSAPASILTSASNYSAGSGSWGDATSPFKMEVTFTPQMRGPIAVRIKCALASSTFYIDPKVVVA